MKDQFVPYELAIILKELEFYEECIMCYRRGIIFGENIAHGYDDNWVFKNNIDYDGYSINKENPNYWVAAPLWQQAFDFLLKKLPNWKLEQEGSKFNLSYLEGQEWNYYSLIDDQGNLKEERIDCLKKLIELVKK